MEDECSQQQQIWFHGLECVSFIRHIQCNMPSDMNFTHIHMRNPSHVQFSEKWQQDKLPEDDVEVPQTQWATSDSVLQNLISTDDEPLIDEATLKHSKRPKTLLWRDLGLADFARGSEPTPDRTILARFATSETEKEFLSHPEESLVQRSAEVQEILQTRLDESFNGSIPEINVSTPAVGRHRTPLPQRRSSYQTPDSRIIR